MPFPKPKAEALFDVVGVGYNSVDHLCVLPKYPQMGSKTKIVEYSVQGGGQTATACAALARLGFSARYIGKFGCAPTGTLAEESLREWNVETERCLRVENCPNQTAIIWIDGETGERTITYQRGRQLDILPGDLDRDSVLSGRVILMDAHNIPAMVEVAKWAKEAGIPTVLDAERILPGIEKLLDLVDYIITDQTFPYRYTGIEDVEEALKKMSDHGPFVAATAGDRGSVAYFDGRILRSPALKIQCVDSTGAGDVFHAGFAAGLLMGFDLPMCLDMANATAGLKCRKLGGRDGIPPLDQAIAAMESIHTS